ncbi:MAG: globin [Candidatus Competibacterales bacterium]
MAMKENYLPVQASYLRCCASTGFFDTFYEIFLQKSPEVAKKFVNTDLKRLKGMLRESLFQMICQSSIEGREAEIERIAEIHSRRGHDVVPELYPLWLDSLCEAVKRHDPGYTAELESIWRRRMEQGIAIMVARY